MKFRWDGQNWILTRQKVKQMNTTQILLWGGVILLLIFIANKYGRKNNNSLHALASKGKCGKLKEVLRNNFKINEQDTEGMTALHLAVLYDHFDCVKLLLDAGANANLAASDGDTPLHTAVDGSKEIVELLLKHRAIVDSKNDYGSTPLQDAVATEDNLDIVKMLLSRGANMHTTNKYGNTLLHEACFNAGTLDTIVFLVEEGLDVTQKNKEGNIPLDEAIEYDNKEAIEFFQSKIKN